MRGKAHRVARPQHSRVTRPKSTKFLIRRRRVISGVKASILVAILPSVVECRCTEWRRGMPIFADSHQKSVTIATSLSRWSRKECRIDHAHPNTYLSWNFGEARSNTFWEWDNIMLVFKGTLNHVRVSFFLLLFYFTVRREWRLNAHFFIKKKEFSSVR